MADFKPINRAEQLPVFQHRVLEARLMFNQAFCPELILCDSDCQNQQDLSRAFQLHVQDVQDIVDRHFKGGSLIEVGCGKGLFPEQLSAAGYDVTGFDTPYEGGSPKVINEYFTPRAGLHADAIALRHVPQHMRDLFVFLCGRREPNGEGLIYIEVPCLGQAAAAWGDASKGVISCLFMNRAGAGINTVIDINPGKQGHCLAARGIRVSSPEEAVARLPDGTDIFVMNSNYLKDIRESTAFRFNY